MYLGSFGINDYVGIPAATHRFSSGAAYVATVLTYSIYEEATNVGIDEDVDMVPASPFDSVTGCYWVRRQLTTAAGFEVGKNYLVVVKATVDSVAAITMHTFQLAAKVDAIAISGGSTAADNAELMFDGTGYAGGTVKLGVSLVSIMASALTGTAAQIAAAFVKFFDKASPTGTVNSLPDAVPDAAGGLPVTGTRLTAMPWNAAWDAEVQSEAQDAITASALATAANLATVAGYIDTEVATLVTELAKVPKSDSTVTFNATALASIQASADAALVANNLDHLALTATAAADMTTEVADGTILSRLLSATGDTSTYLQGTDSHEAIRDRGDLAWATGAGAAADLAYVPSGAPTITTKHADAVGGAYTDLAVVDGALFSIREAATTNPPLDFYFPFAAAAGVFPSAITIWGYYSGNSTHWMRVQAAVGGVTTVWEDVGTIPNGTAVTAYSFALTPEHINPSTGAAYIRFLHNDVAGVASHYLYLDKVLFTAQSATPAFATAAELAKVPKSDSNVTWNATALASMQTEANDALVANNLDHLALTATAAADMTTEVADNTILSRILGNGDTSTFVPSTDGLHAAGVDLDAILADTGTDGVLVAAGGIASTAFAAGAINAAAIATDAIGPAEVDDTLSVLADVRKINNTTLTGNGGLVPWGPA
jgi:hypothetical protein